MAVAQSQTKYYIYARKSSESDERQVQSIDDQMATMNAIAKSYGLTIVDTIRESKSAKEPHGRPEFEQLIKRIQAGEAHGILVWKIDRLSRNPIDSAMIQWLLQNGVIASIRTPDREYRPEDNALLLSVETSIANQYIRDLSTNVKRGLKSKLDKGWMPTTAPLGYLNTKTEARGENYIIKDPDRFPLIRQAWELMLTGAYVPDQILDKLNHEWGFRTRGWKKKGGKPMSRSTIYRVFTNQFYAGIIPYKGQLAPGKHEPMVTLDEFDTVQFILGREGKPRPNRHRYAYNGLIRCGECGGFISATFKEKLIKTTGKLQRYYLYYCTRARREGGKCSQRYYTNVDQIEEQVERELMALTILPEFKKWALDVIADMHDEEATDRTAIYASQQKALHDAQKQLDTLTQMRLKDLIDDEEYLREKARLRDYVTVISTKMKEREQRADNWLTLTEQTFEFAGYAHKAFLFGDAHTKREILSSIGDLNCTLKDHLLNIQAVEWLVPIKEKYPAEAKMRAFEPEKYGLPEWEKAAFAALNPEVRALVDAVGTAIREHNSHIFMMNFRRSIDKEGREPTRFNRDLSRPPVDLADV
jgi:site-specific DNA recombinase